MTLSCIIIEDEPLAVKKLEGFIAKIPFLSLKSCFDNAIHGLAFLKTNNIDIVFLDIEMDGLTGIQFLEVLDNKPYIVITSAYAQYALKGYELCVFDYLLKPYSFERFIQAVNKIIDDKTKKSIPVLPVNKEHLFVKTEYRIENLVLNDILYIAGMQGYLQIVTATKKIMTKQSFRSLLDQLPTDRFIQVHKSWIVQLSKIESIERNRIKIAGCLIPIGDSYKDSFSKIINKSND